MSFTRNHGRSNPMGTRVPRDPSTRMEPPGQELHLEVCPTHRKLVLPSLGCCPACYRDRLLTRSDRAFEAEKTLRAQAEKQIRQRRVQTIQQDGHTLKAVEIILAPEIGIPYAPGMCNIHSVVSANRYGQCPKCHLIYSRMQGLTTDCEAEEDLKPQAA